MTAGPGSSPLLSRPVRGLGNVSEMADQVTLRPVAEDDLSFLELLSNDPARSGQHEWHGWSNPGSLRRGWAETGLLGDTGGMLMVVRGADRIGCVSWRKTQTGAIAYCLSLGIGLAPPSAEWPRHRVKRTCLHCQHRGHTSRRRQSLS